MHRLVKWSIGRTLRACEEAARLLSLATIPMSREEAADMFLSPGRQVRSDVLAFSGEIVGVQVLLAAFTHDSNTMVNGVLVPITATHVVARLPRPLPGTRVEISRRVFGSPKSEATLGEPCDSRCVVLGDDPSGLAAVLGGDHGLLQRIVAVIEDGQGAARVFSDRVASFIAHRDPDRIRRITRSAAELARLLARSVSERSPLR
ncbi:MAG: hypothetical protein SFX73_35990 [Kofleriaceae bacterium]|nr:hypothetical protein [Kofleriaceae bacterium]